MEQAVVQAFSKRGMHGVLYPSKLGLIYLNGDHEEPASRRLAMRRIATLLADVGESRFENVTDWLPPASVELKKSQMFDRPKARRSSADFDPW
jgi:hypothetical protein